MPGFVAPDARYQRSFLAAAAELLAEGRGGDDDTSAEGELLRDPPWRGAGGFEEFVRRLRAAATPGAPMRPGFVPDTTLWWVEGDEYLGRLSVRHALNDWLHDYGGHIGYIVRPSARRQGHATAMLRAGLPVAHALGIDPALLTCDLDNLASRRIIERAGGVLEDRRGDKLRFWMPTS